jgi:hypothetical protein
MDGCHGHFVGIRCMAYFLCFVEEPVNITVIYPGSWFGNRSFRLKSVGSLKFSCQQDEEIVDSCGTICTLPSKITLRVSNSQLLGGPFLQTDLRHWPVSQIRDADGNPFGEPPVKECWILRLGLYCPTGSSRRLPGTRSKHPCKKNPSALELVPYWRRLTISLEL